MSKTIDPEKIAEIASILPKKERNNLALQTLSKEWLLSQIELCQKRMKRDLWVGLPWFLTYTFLLFTKGVSAITMGIFAVGMAYFAGTIFTTGSYGLNKNRLKVYKKLLQLLEHQ